MSTLIEDIARQKARFLSIKKLLKEITPQTGEELTPAIVLLASEIENEKNRLVSVYSDAELEPYLPDFRKDAKLISEKFDNVVVAFRNMLAEINLALADISNKKRLNQYLK